jgi:hypothetical protein
MRLEVEQLIGQDRISEVVQEIKDKKMTKSAGIRELFAGGLSVKDIAVETGIIYTHVYNIVRNEVLIHGLEVVDKGRTKEGKTQKDQILELLEKGKSLTEISIELKCLYNRVWQVAKEGGFTNKQKAAAKQIKKNIDEHCAENVPNEDDLFLNLEGEV